MKLLGRWIQNIYVTIAICFDHSRLSEFTGALTLTSQAPQYFSIFVKFNELFVEGLYSKQAFMVIYDVIRYEWGFIRILKSLKVFDMKVIFKLF